LGAIGSLCIAAPRADLDDVMMVLDQLGPPAGSGRTVISSRQIGRFGDEPPIGGAVSTSSAQAPLPPMT
jgi:hypothetical protein